MDGWKRKRAAFMDSSDGQCYTQSFVLLGVFAQITYFLVPRRFCGALNRRYIKCMHAYVRAVPVSTDGHETECDRKRQGHRDTGRQTDRVEVEEQGEARSHTIRHTDKHVDKQTDAQAGTQAIMCTCSYTHTYIHTDTYTDIQLGTQADTTYAVRYTGIERHTFRYAHRDKQTYSHIYINRSA